MNNNQSSYTRWTWIIALLLALALLWMLLTGKGSNGTCCHDQIADLAPAAVTETMPTEQSTISEAFSFSATESEYTSNGNANEINWINDIDALKALLSDGIMAEGNETSVILTGSTDSEEAKQQKGTDAQAFFGPDVSIDNQITVVMAEPVETPPATAKIYFDIGYHGLPADGPSALEPIITWLSSHPDAKVVISGYHDPTGDLASNQLLAKKRAQSTYNALLAGGINAESIEMRKPESTEGDGDLSEARRVEVSIE
jgi:outer membrane protein OmpA-like peptidoglycan-associated protein